VTSVPVREPDAIRGALDVVALGVQAANAYGRPDLVARLSAAQARLADPAVHVMVVGEFKQGKSSLVNALVDSVVCPVDDDVATAVPTLVRYADPPIAQVVFEPEGAEDARVEEIPFDDLPVYASETGNPGNQRRVRSVEAGVPNALLSRGLVLVDTPGVGGLGSVHSAITMAALPVADALVFVTDASQELSAPEFDFLRRARELCPNIVMVLTKIDFYSEWRRMMRVDLGRLQEAGLAVDVLPVSSTLQSLATTSGASDLAVESGFPELVAYLADGIVANAAHLEVRSAAHDVLAVAEQLDEMFRAERAALDDPDKVAAMISELEAAKARADELRGNAARWQVTLGDGIADLNADVDYDLRMRTREILREAEDAIDQADPARVWDEFEPWLYRKVAYEVAENYALLARRTAELGEQVADHFRDAELELDLALQVTVPTPSSERLGVSAHLEMEVPGAGTQGLAALRGGYGGMMMFGMLSGVAGLTMMNPISVVLGLALGKRTFNEERDRQFAMRRQQAKAAVRRYVDEASFQVGNDSREALRRVQRQFRDAFEARANELQRTTAESLAAVQRAAQTSEEARVRRLRDVDAELERVAGLGARARALAPDLAPPAQP
jgi:hypothetical protein